MSRRLAVSPCDPEEVLKDQASKSGEEVCFGAKQGAMPKDLLTERLHSHFTEAEAEAIRKAAAKDERKVSAFIRRMVIRGMELGKLEAAIKQSLTDSAGKARPIEVTPRLKRK